MCCREVWHAQWHMHGWNLFWYVLCHVLFWLWFCRPKLPLVPTCSDIVSGCFWQHSIWQIYRQLKWHILWHILFPAFSPILQVLRSSPSISSGTLRGISSVILTGTPSGNQAGTFLDILSRILTGISACCTNLLTSVWDSIRLICGIPGSMRHIVWHSNSKWHIFWHVCGIPLSLSLFSVSYQPRKWYLSLGQCSSSFDRYKRPATPWFHCEVHRLSHGESLWYACAKPDSW